MFDARDLLGRLMQAGLSDSTNERLGHAMGPSGLGRGSNPLSDIFSQISGIGRGGQAAGGPGRGELGGLGGGLGGLGGSLGGGLGGLAEMAESVFGQATGAVRSGNPLAVGGLAALAGALLGGGKGASRGALGGGLLAVLGSLAYSALQSRDQGAAATTMPPPLGLGEPQTAEEEQALNDIATLVVRAMINAAKADGEIDAGEKARIVEKLGEDGADADARAFVEAEMHTPADTAALVKAVAGRPDVAIQVYAASLLAIEVDTAAEAEYLRGLAASLGLDAATVEQIHQTLDVGLPAAV